jgi:hypothetical protein
VNAPGCLDPEGRVCVDEDSGPVLHHKHHLQSTTCAPENGARVGELPNVPPNVVGEDWDHTLPERASAKEDLHSSTHTL